MDWLLNIFIITFILLIVDLALFLASPLEIAHHHWWSALPGSGFFAHWKMTVVHLLIKTILHPKFSGEDIFAANLIIKSSEKGRKCVPGFIVAVADSTPGYVPEIRSFYFYDWRFLWYTLKRVQRWFCW